MDSIEHRFLPGSRLTMELLGTIATPNKAIIVSVYALTGGPSPFTVRARAVTGWAAPGGVPLVLQWPWPDEIGADNVEDAWESARAIFAKMVDAMRALTPNNPLMATRPSATPPDPKKSS